MNFFTFIYYQQSTVHIGLLVPKVQQAKLRLLSKARRRGLLAFHLGEPGSNIGKVIPGFSHSVGIVPDDVAGERVFSGISRISRFPHPCFPALLHVYFTSNSPALKTSMPRAVKISPLHKTVLPVREIQLKTAPPVSLLVERRAEELAWINASTTEILLRRLETAVEELLNSVDTATPVPRQQMRRECWDCEKA
ncbi:hypothetical protein PR048_002157 [Dryococelus australis]|uniref:Uncharacterized protein n=1 Tax=Dryococelus australis TaxID=614101 RepID=A0ABQ9IKI1_9NEOP|nr:hypothetical protein PR048_002157 [Dryococelus australis]